MRRAAKIDVNQPELVKAFRTLGCSVTPLAAVGKGVPDLLVAWCGVTMLVEVKAPKGKETEDQLRFFEGWQGQIFIVRDVEGVLTVVRLLKEQALLLSTKGSTT
jgi:Holliday junction resolvase